MTDFLSDLREVEKGQTYLWRGKTVVNGSDPVDAFVRMIREVASYDGVSGKIVPIKKKTITVTSDPHKAERDKASAAWEQWQTFFKQARAKEEAWTLNGPVAMEMMNLVLGSSKESVKRLKTGELNPVSEEVVQDSLLAEEFTYYRPGTSATPHHRICGITAPVAKWVWLLVYGKLPPMRLENIDGDKYNNRIENLRVYTPRNSLPYQCVVLRDGKQHHLGRYATREEVRAAREDFLNFGAVSKAVGG